jgi:hypothetical protein
MSVPGIFLGFGTDEYSSIIFLGTEEYNKDEEDTMFSYSVSFSFRTEWIFVLFQGTNDHRSSSRIGFIHIELFQYLLDMSRLVYKNTI